MSKQSSNNFLPPKELSIFKRIVKYYDQKQYKNGLKYAKQILSNPKYSEHGETLAMKGILLNCLGKKDEAREYVKRGLKADITSFICWHIYGLIHKSDHQYEEAIKCYLHALKLDNDNLVVLRDLCVLQMQLRDYEGCKETRCKLLLLRPYQKASWIGYALIRHLLGDYETALTVISEFRKAQSDIPTHDYGNSELMLYQASIMLEAGMEQAALEHLDKYSKEIVDKTSLLEMKAQILLKLGKIEETISCCWDLIDRNQEYRLYFDLLAQANGLKDPNTPEGNSIMRKTLESVISRHPKARLPRCLMLKLLSGDEFEKQLDSYLQPQLRKGVPPLFIQLLDLWKDESKLVTLEQIIARYRKNMELYGTLNTPEEQSEKDSPCTSIWLNYFYAQLLNYKGCHKEALEVIDNQLASTPTLVDFYVLKADVFHDAGDNVSASRWMEEAQSLDTADRYINARCTNYMVKAHRLEDAINMASKFTRGSTSARDYLSEVQCMWFLLETARSLKDMGKYGEALKTCHEIHHHYESIFDDQLDFHSYCLREVTLRAYVETLRLEDRLRDHQSYLDVTVLAVEIYLHLYAQPLGTNDESLNGDHDNLSSAESKKIRNKQRKAARKAEAEAARIRAEQERREQAVRSRQPATEETNTENQNSVDSSLDPKALSRPNDPLTEAAKFLVPLLDLNPKTIEPYCMAFEVYSRKKKFLLMLKWISKGLQIPNARDHPWFHECCVRFLLLLNKRSSLDPLVENIILEEVPNIFPEWSNSASDYPERLNQEFMSRNSQSFPHTFRGTIIRCMIWPEKRDEYLENLPLPSSNLKNVTWQECASALKILRTGFATPLGRCDIDLTNRFREACALRFPMANAFLTDADLDKLRSEMVAAASQTSVNGIFANYNSLEQHNDDHAEDGLTQQMDALSMNPDHMVNGDTECCHDSQGKSICGKSSAHKKGDKCDYHVSASTPAVVL